MKEVIRYEDNGGELWNTKEEALIADSKMVLSEFFSLYCSHCDLDEWIDDAKNDPKIIKALLHVLDVDDTKIAVDRLMDKNGK